MITGGSRGLGKELASLLASEGSQIVICSRNKKELKKVCEEITSRSGRCEYFVADVTNGSQVDKLIKSVLKKYGRIDVLINNAGYVNKWKGVEKITLGEFEDCLKTNVYSVFYFLRTIAPIMRKQNQGAIITISSMAGKRAVPNLSAYSASKFAAIGLTQSVAKELKGTNVFCISVCPGGMKTGMREKVFGPEAAHKQQDPKFVASIIRDILIDNVKVPHGGDIVIRYGKIAAINQPPE